MTNFSKVKLGDVLTFQRGFDITKEEQSDGGVPIVSSSGVSSYHSKWKVEGPGVVIGRKGTLGTVHFIQGNFWPHDTTLWVKDFKGNSPRFLSYFLRTLRLENFDVGASNPTLNRNHIHKIRIVFPNSVETQRRIAAILSSYDDLIENNKRRISLLEKLAKEIYREWIVRFRFPGHEKLKIVRGVPSGWEVRTLGSLANEIKKGIRKKDLADVEKYIGLEHISRRSIALNEWAAAATVDSNKLLFQARDILFGKIRPYLHKVALAHFPGACSSDTIVIRPKEKIYEGYLLFTIFSDTFIELATVASKGTKMPRADWGFLKKLELAVPNEKLLKTYQAQFDPLFSQIVNLLRANESLGISRERLLPRLISGKLSVGNLDIQFPPSLRDELKATAPAADYA